MGAKMICDCKVRVFYHFSFCRETGHESNPQFVKLVEVFLNKLELALYSLVKIEPKLGYFFQREKTINRSNDLFITETSNHTRVFVRTYTLRSP